MSTKEASKPTRSSVTIPLPVAHHVPAAERLAGGKAMRESVPRRTHGAWKREKARVKPLEILRASDVGRIERLVPIRYGRMLETPFTFYRGAAAVMAADLAHSPSSGIRVQACGDCHLLNFGGFATPERNVLFDINDFDETLPAPWEWDVKRLVASVVLAARNNGFSDSAARDAAVACAESYRTRLREFSEMSPLEVWYARITDKDIVAAAPNKRIRQRIEQRVTKAMAVGGSDLAFPQIAAMVSGHVRIRDNPPLIYHPEDLSVAEIHELLDEVFKNYLDTLSDDRRKLLERYRLVDGAYKVVGIGSVGTFCLVLLMMSAGNEPLFLQAKEARQSVLEPYAGKSAYPHPGQRVVMGQRLMQPATDIFLGWVTGKHGRQAYVRQLRDAKIKPIVELLDGNELTQYARWCAWALARAHAKSGDSLAISGYLGTNGPFDEALGDFAIAYADQTERDHAALKAAVKAGKIEVFSEA